VTPATGPPTLFLHRSYGLHASCPHFRDRLRVQPLTEIEKKISSALAARIHDS